jgi:hypothetical protein
MSVVRAGVLAGVVASSAFGAGCGVDGTILPASRDTLTIGTWGGDNAGLIVNDTIAHAHIGCTLGNFPAPVALERGRFSVTGAYVLRAYPVYIGPELPAQFTGEIDGNRLTLRVSVNDTVERKVVNLGPVTVTFGREPKMGPCPICKTIVDRR